MIHSEFEPQTVVMTRHDRSRRSDKGRLTDIHDDTSVLTTQSYHISYLPLRDLTPSLTLPSSDHCDITDGPVSPSRMSVPVINRFSPVLGWRTFLQLLGCRATESITFSVPDCNSLWSRTDNDLRASCNKEEYF